MLNFIKIIILLIVIILYIFINIKVFIKFVKIIQAYKDFRIRTAPVLNKVFTAGNIKEFKIRQKERRFHQNESSAHVYGDFLRTSTFSSNGPSVKSHILMSPQIVKMTQDSSTPKQ